MREFANLYTALDETNSTNAKVAALADYFEEETDRQAEALTALLEPALIVLVGALLGGILVAMYLPMFDLITVVGP